MHESKSENIYMNLEVDYFYVSGSTGWLGKRSPGRMNGDQRHFGVAPRGA